MIKRDSVVCHKCGTSLGSFDTGTGDIHLDFQVPTVPNSVARVTGMLCPERDGMILVCPNCHIPVSIKAGRRGGGEVIEKSE